MNIAIDIETALSSPTGIGRYTRSIVTEFARQGSKHNFWLFHSSNFSKSESSIFSSLPANFTVYRLKYSRRTLRLWSLIGRLPNRARKPFPSIPDLLFSPSGNMIPLEAHLRIGTIHDISVIDDTSLVSALERFVTRREFGQLIRRSDRVVTVSEFSRSRIIEQWNIEPGQVVSVYEGCEIDGDPPKNGHSEGESSPLKSLTSTPFFLWSGAMMRRKNLIRLIEAFSRVSSQTGHDLTLVFTGPDGNDSARVTEAVKKYGITESFTHLGIVDNQSLRKLMQTAAAFIFPSTYEGFGLPIIEAMTLGTPVITSDATATREIAGGAALLIDPLDVGSIENAMMQILADSDLTDRLRIAGKKQAANFHWSATASSLLEIFEDA